MPATKSDIATSSESEDGLEAQQAAGKPVRMDRIPVHRSD